MGVPLADMVQAVAVFHGVADGQEVVHILVEEGRLVIGPRSGTDGIEDDGSPVLRPVAEQLAAGLDVRAVEDTTGEVIQFRLEDDGFPPVMTVRDRTLFSRAAFQPLHQALAPGIDRGR